MNCDRPTLSRINAMKSRVLARPKLAAAVNAGRGRPPPH